MTTGDGPFVPVTITGATAQALRARHGYSRVVYRLSALVPAAWIARFDATCRVDVARWPDGWPIAHADRIEVMLPDRAPADRAALAATRAHLATAIATANRQYGQLSPEVLAAGAREIAWEQQVLTSLQAALDEQFPG